MFKYSKSKNFRTHSILVCIWGNKSELKKQFAEKITCKFLEWLCKMQIHAN